MGEVYRARDAKLNREVALKILPEAVASDPDRLGRFTREAQTLAALNHPNVGGIYGIEDSQPVRALVMELIEGDDLSVLISRGAIPLDEALPIARQIAEALEAAHDHGIIHRDLKPANIKVRTDGTVKVLDFGLAKALDPTAGSSVSAMNSPTLSMHATQAGIILGTAAYMSPEQAKGKAVDRRADIWSFGVVLYEMLTGQRAFKGDDVTDTLASVLKDRPGFDALPASTPPRLRWILERCLERDPRARLRDIGEARVQLAAIARGDADVGAPLATSTAAPAWTGAWPWGVALALALALMLVWAPWRVTTPRPSPIRLSAELGADVSVAITSFPAMTLSPNGGVIAFVAQKPGGDIKQIYVRRLTELQARALPGTQGADYPFFSPDGQWIAFFSEGKLKKIAVTGGAATTLCDAPLARGGAWSVDGTIVFVPDRVGTLMRVSSAGGTPAAVMSLAPGEVTQRWPQMLPGGRAVLFTGNSIANANFDDANLVVQALPTGERTIVQRGGYHGRYLESGHLVYVHHGTLFAAPFDLSRLAITGLPVPVLEGVRSNAESGGAQYAVSANGTLVYLPGESTSGGGVPMHWVDQNGKTATLRTTLANWINVMFAPDGRRLALQILEVGQSDIWVYEWARDTLTRLTTDRATDEKPVWSPDGTRIAFASGRANAASPNLFWQRADGTGEAQRLTESNNAQRPAAWHPSGKFLIFEEVNPTTNTDLMALPMGGDESSGWKPGTPAVFLNSPFQESEAAFSPDGRWLAYVSNEGGRSDVYVRPFPGPGGKWRVSTEGGRAPVWSQTKRELFFGSITGQIMVAPYAATGDAFNAEKPRLWAERRYQGRGPNRMFDLHPDGTRVALALVEEAPGVKQDKLTFLFNFFEELRRIATVAKP